jgi:hypothetical protein
LLAVPFGEGLEELETVGGGRDLDQDGSGVRGRRLECVLTWVVAARREFEARGRRELKGGSGGCCDGVCERIEGEGTSEGECGDDVRRSDESVSGRVGIVTARKVAVVRSDN